MKKITLLFFCFLAINLFSQNQKERFENSMNIFSTQFNASEYDSIYNTFSKPMQEAISIDKLVSFLKSQKEVKGKILNSTFYKYKLGWATFKTYFEKDSSLVKIGLDNNFKIAGFQILPIKEKEITITNNNKNKNSINMILPFHGTWFVTWGGDSIEQNYHIESKAQKNAFDFLIKDNNGKTHKLDGKNNENYYAFGKEIIAPLEAKIVMVVDGVPDNEPGVLNPLFVSGNTVVLQTKDNQFLFFAHFKKHSINVREGDIVKQGQLLGLCGNSGNSSEPHLHFHIQNTNNMMTGTGIKSYFKSILVDKIEKNNYSPVRGELIKNK